MNNIIDRCKHLIVSKHNLCDQVSVYNPAFHRFRMNLHAQRMLYPLILIHQGFRPRITVIYIVSHSRCKTAYNRFTTANAACHSNNTHKL